MKRVKVAIIGAGPYGLSVAAHLASRNIEHRIFGKPMEFWSKIAQAGNGRFLKSYCFATNVSSPNPGYSFNDHNGPRGLETFEPCSMQNFTDYGRWFQKENVSWAESVNVSCVSANSNGFQVLLANGDACLADRVVVATGLAYFDYVPSSIASLPGGITIHTSKIDAFRAYKGKTIAVVGAGQSSLEAAALLLEAGAKPELLIREDKVFWQERIQRERSTWQRLRSPLAGLGTGPKSWVLTNFPNAMHRLPENWRLHLVKTQFGAMGAWWLRERVEGLVPFHLETAIASASERGGKAALKLRSNGKERELVVDHVVAGTGYKVDLDRISFLDAGLRETIKRTDASPNLNSVFESSVRGLHFIGPTSAMSFGPLFRFVAGAHYTSRVLSSHIAQSFARLAA